MQRLLRLALAAAFLLTLLIPAAAQEFKAEDGPALDPSKDYYALFHTTRGKITVRLRPDRAPVAVRNFVNLAEGTRPFKDPRTGAAVQRPYYDGSVFHRVGKGFMIQGGDPTGTGMGGPGYTIPDEYDAEDVYDRGGYLAMARTQAPNSGGSQFFLTEGPTQQLNGSYTIFGEVVDAKDVELIAQIAGSPLRAGGDGTGRPLRDVYIERLQIVRVDKGTPAETVVGRPVTPPTPPAPAAVAPATPQ